MKKYRIHVSDRTLIWNAKNKVMDWKEGTGDDDKVVESYDTVEECFNSMNNWGSRWVMYPSAYIETEEDEIWASILEEMPCRCCFDRGLSTETCKNPVYDHIEDGFGKSTS